MTFAEFTTSLRAAGLVNLAKKAEQIFANSKGGIDSVLKASSGPEMANACLRFGYGYKGRTNPSIVVRDIGGGAVVGTVAEELTVKQKLEKLLEEGREMASPEQIKALEDAIKAAADVEQKVADEAKAEKAKAWEAKLAKAGVFIPKGASLEVKA